MAALVSVLTVVYNNVSTIRDALESVLNQDYPNIQYIIIDGGSSDGTLSILKEYEGKVHTIISEKDKGIYHAMNKGIALCEGEWIAILNSDDIYSDNTVLSQVNRYFEQTKADAVYGNLQYVDPKNLSKVVRVWESDSFNREKFLYGWMPPHPAFFLKTKHYHLYGAFREDFVIAADYELMLRMLYKFRLTAVWIPKVLVKMRTGGISNRDFQRRIQANSEDKLAWQINQLKPYFFTMYIKPIRKILQFLPIISILTSKFRLFKN